MSELPVLPGTHPNGPPCVVCDSSEHVLQVDLPECRNIHCYRCLGCGLCWATTLRGDRILTGEGDDSMLFV